MSSITIYLTNSLGAPLSGQTVKLRRAGLGNFGSDYLTMFDVAGKPGKYKTVEAHVTDRYKVWVNGSEDESFGGPDGIEITLQSDILLKTGGTMSGAINMGGNKVTNLDDAVDGGDALPFSQAEAAYLKKSGGTMSGSIDMGNNPVINVADGSDGKDAVNFDSLDQRLVDEDYAKRQANNTMTGDNIHSGTNTFSDQVAFSTYAPICDVDPTTDDHLVRKEWVDDQLADLVITPFQEASNVLRLIPSGVQETGKIYTTYAAAQNYARGYVNSNWRYIIEIPGGGEGSVSITITDGAIPGNSAFNSYVSLKGGNQNVKLLISDAAYSVTAGTVIVENCTIYLDDSGNGTPSFTNFVFKDCYFDFDVQDLTFSACDFRGVCKIKNTGGSITFTNCKGGIVESNADLPATVRGWGGLSTSDF